ncbi:MAG TPA: murein L,D-transpeptidase catalytic domain family protein [Puia sp.]|nr:murein L,D-transpeptidase catalytic domain family protein [Puia sp.]
MRLFTNLCFKVTLSSMILTAPAMRTGNTDYGTRPNLPMEKERTETYYASAVIRNFVDHPSVRAMSAVSPPDFPAESENRSAFTAVAAAGSSSTARAVAATERSRPVVAAVAVGRVAAPVVPTVSAVIGGASLKAISSHAVEKERELPFSAANLAGAKAAQVRMLTSQAILLYASMDLDSSGLDEKAFEYAWRGYHHLLEKGMIHKKAVLSICDFSQPSSSKRMYVIDVRRKRLLYRTYVAHGQNSGDEYATSFSNEVDSYKSSLGFYVTQRTYMGRNGLSLRLNGVDSGYNDMAAKRKIVLHGSSYVSDKYMQEFGTLGTSLGCPAIPSAVSGRIIRLVKGGSCLFIYHPTPQYLDNSSIING